ncbi:hypothetical protein [endosymbiont GvMRE of Glomus versiforme]|uniref:hypothetical protein n=1 Tax=endosymbiont GvMRE of Glomus versiforme TaxID=2039283 RepID=UPI000ED55218|nr:hypothetical protein [endosymbiont GvMRE of Glomus versiforme]RHZ36572.1 hypothetical protein GvMRE_I2g235 [endosymbiont GvMRE of Glomus versiforme]
MVNVYCSQCDHIWGAKCPQCGWRPVDCERCRKKEELNLLTVSSEYEDLKKEIRTLNSSLGLKEIEKNDLKAENRGLQVALQEISQNVKGKLSEWERMIERRHG